MYISNESDTKQRMFQVKESSQATQVFAPAFSVSRDHNELAILLTLENNSHARHKGSK